MSEQENKSVNESSLLDKKHGYYTLREYSTPFTAEELRSLESRKTTYFLEHPPLSECDTSQSL